MRIYTLKGVKDLRALISVHKRMPDMRLGEVLVDENLISQEQLEVALDAQKTFKSGSSHIGQILVERGLVSVNHLNIALAKKLAIPYVKLDDYEVLPELISRIPGEIAQQFRMLPLADFNGTLVVAMVNPLDQRAIDALRFNTKMNIEAVMVSAEDIEASLNKYYSTYEEFDNIDDLELDSISEPQQDEALHNIEQEASTKPIVRLLNAIVLQGVTRGASDINIRPEKNKVSVYFRVDGKMQFVRTLSRSILPALVSRVKITGQMDISERRLPQDGHARMVRGGKQVDLRISIMPTVNGESVVIRILDKSVGFKPVEELGMREADLDAVKRLISRPNGMFLVTGPTGSGKSTTLYALLNEVKKSNPHILTIEDPVESDMEGVEQIQVSLAKGFTFAQALRQFLRHDPDVIMVGEIRDSETAEIANKAALTGHLVFSTLHTNDAPSTVTRLLDMGIEPYLLSSTLVAVAAQRLVRRNCPECVSDDVIDEHMLRVLKLDPNDKYRRGAGCEKCHYTGYKGRLAVIELLQVSPDIQNAIIEGKSSKEIAEIATSEGMRTLADAAHTLANQGLTSIEEVYALCTQ